MTNDVWVHTAIPNAPERQCHTLKRMAHEESLPTPTLKECDAKIPHCFRDVPVYFTGACQPNFSKKRSKVNCG